MRSTIISTLFGFIILCTFLPQATLAGRNLNTATNTNIRIAFGSCLKPYLEPDVVLNKIAESNPDVFVWLGDVAYTDINYIPFPMSPFVMFAGEEKYRARLEETKNLSSYQHLKNKSQVVGVWDDHDYGINDGGITFKYKNITQSIWLDFIDEPADSPRRKQKGIWDSYYIGKNQKVKLILLDTRYYKNGRFFGNDTLGEVQWKWLENELKNNKAEVVLIANGYQILPDDRFIPETWFYESRERLYDLVNKYRVNGVVLMSGDVHTGEIMCNPCSKQRIGYDLYEITSSGITHTITGPVKYFAEAWMPPTYDIRDDNMYQDLNFGIINVNLTFGHVSNISLQIRDKTGNIIIEKSLPYSALIRNETLIGDHENCSIYAKSPFRRLFEYHLTHLSNISTRKGKRGVLLYSLVLGVLLAIFCFSISLCCCRKQKNINNKEKQE